MRRHFVARTNERSGDIGHSRDERFLSDDSDEIMMTARAGHGSFLPIFGVVLLIWEGNPPRLRLEPAGCQVASRRWFLP